MENGCQVNRSIAEPRLGGGSGGTTPLEASLEAAAGLAYNRRPIMVAVPETSRTPSKTLPCSYTTGGLPDWKIKRVQAFILKSLYSNISSEDMATVCGLSVTHFQRAFRRSFDCSPHRYVTKVRLEQARRMLLETDWPIKYIALECGMADQSHLNKVLKREWSITPRELRRAGGRDVFGAAGAIQLQP